MTFTTFVLWVHLVCIVLWTGGLFAVSLVCVPVLRAHMASPEGAARLAATVMRRFQRVSRELIFLVFLTGIFNVINAGVARSFAFSGVYLTMLFSKVALFAAMIGVQAWQTMRLTPAMDPVGDNVDTDLDDARRARRLFGLASWLNVLLAVVVVLLGVSLRYR